MGCILLLGFLLGQSYGQTYRNYLNLGNPGFGGGPDDVGAWTQRGSRKGTLNMVGENGQTYANALAHHKSLGDASYQFGGITSRKQNRAGLNMIASKPKLLKDLQRDWSDTCQGAAVAGGADLNDPKFNKCFAEDYAGPRDTANIMDKATADAKMAAKSNDQVAAFLKVIYPLVIYSLIISQRLSN